MGKFSYSLTSLILTYLLLSTSGIDASVIEVYSDFCALFGNTSALQPYDIDQITSKILNQVNCSKNPNLDCMNCLSSQKLQAANIIGTSISPDDLGRVSLLAYCYLNDLNQFCQVGSTPDYSVCLGYLTNYTNSINTATLTSSLGNRIAPIYQVSNDYHPIQGISWDTNVRNETCIDGKYLVMKYQNQPNLVQGASRLNGLYSDIIYMMYNNMRLGCDMPYSNWFINQLFTKNGLVGDSINVQDLSSIMTKMGMSTSGSSLVVKNYALQNLLLSQNMTVPNDQISTQNGSSSNVYNMNYNRCYSPNELAEIFSQTPNSMSQSDFSKLAPSLIYMSQNSICPKQNDVVVETTTTSSQETTSRMATPAEKYGYGTIAIVIVSLLALLGIVLIPCFGKSAYPTILMVLTALAVGTLLSDAMLHLIPDILNVEADETTYMYIPQYAIYVSASIGAIWIFWIVETIIHHFAHIERVVSHSHGGFHDDDVDHHNDHCHPEECVDEKIKTVTGVTDNGVTIVPTDSGHQLTEKKTKLKYIQMLRFGKLDVKKIRATGWILLLGDAIHNFADGMAIGASFADSPRMGIATTIAVVCHEVPHELGNYAVLVKSGFSHCQALIFNLFSATTCLIGFYIGASVSTDPLVSTWIFTITAGMFLYLALVDLLPQVMHAIKWSWPIFIACNLAMLFGYGVMLMLVVIEGHINI